jgi:hypothetical protein
MTRKRKIGEAIGGFIGAMIKGFAYGIGAAAALHLMGVVP